MDFLNSEYWNKRYKESDTPWDIGAPSTPLIEFAKTIENKALHILIPGAGKAYEAVFLHKAGFENVLVCDWAETSFDFLKKEAPDFPRQNMLECDFFAMNLKVDLILEQTFFCAIDPAQRWRYAQKSFELLNSGGRLAGVLFASHFEKPGPPFGGDAAEYRRIFEEFFIIQKLEPAYNSIAPRAGNELFIELLKA